MLYRITPTTDILLFSEVDINVVRKGSTLEITIFAGIQIVELIILIISIPILPIAIHILHKSAIFHRNLLNILSFYLFNYFFALGTRVILILYQYKLLEIKENWLLDLPLLVCTFLRLFMYLAAITTLVIIAIERCFATLLLRDYERRKRPWIFIALQIGGWSTNCFLCCMYMWFGPKYIVYILMCTLPASLGSILYQSTCFFFLYRNNYRRLKNLKRTYSPRLYTLSVRFQLEENVKALKLIRNFMVFSAIGNFIGSFLFCIPLYFYTVESVHRQLWAELFECFAAVYAICALEVFSYSIPSWRREFHNIIRSFVRHVIFCGHAKPQQQQRDIKVQPVHDTARNNKETEEYFTNLRDQWK